MEIRSLEEGMATHSSILVWRIQWTEEPVKLQSMGLHTVRHNCELSTHITKINMKSLIMGRL